MISPHSPLKVLLLKGALLVEPKKLLCDGLCSLMCQPLLFDRSNRIIAGHSQRQNRVLLLFGLPFFALCTVIIIWRLVSVAVSQSAFRLRSGAAKPMKFPTALPSAALPYTFAVQEHTQFCTFWLVELNFVLNPDHHAEMLKGSVFPLLI